MTATAFAPYAAFVRAAFLKTLAYRLRYYTGVVTYLIYVTTYYFLWKALYAWKEPGESMQGFDLESMATYIAVGWMARSFYFNNVDRDIADLIREGDVAMTLARPVSFHGMMIADAFGASLFRLLCFTPPVAIVLFLLFPLKAPATGWAGLAFFVSCFLSLLIFAHVNLLVGMMAFRLHSIQGIMRAKHYLLELLSGLLMPVTFFPGWLENLSRWLPFQDIAYLPASLYLGRFPDAQLWQPLLRQSLWVLGLGLLAAWIWSRESRRLTVHGG